MTELHFETLSSPDNAVDMASTHGLSARLSAMEARLDCMTDTVDSLKDIVANLHTRVNQADTAMRKMTAMSIPLVNMLHRLQPLANCLSPLSNVPNPPRVDSMQDRGLGDMDYGISEQGQIDNKRISTDTRSSKDTPSSSSQPSQLRRRRRRSNLKANYTVGVSSTSSKEDWGAAKVQVAHQTANYAASVSSTASEDDRYASEANNADEDQALENLQDDHHTDYITIGMMFDVGSQS